MNKFPDQYQDKSLKQSPSSNSSYSGYVFKGPSRVAIRTRTNDQPKYVDTSLSVWRWYDGGVAMSIDWDKLELNHELIEIGKGFIAYVLEKYAPRTAEASANSLRAISITCLASGLPWDDYRLSLALQQIKINGFILISFRRFYRWAMGRGIKGFDHQTYLKINNVKSDVYKPYKSIFLSQECLDPYEEILVLQRIDQEDIGYSFKKLQLNMLLHLSFELGPRAIQFHSLNVDDFDIIESVDGEMHYSLWLPMPKKRGQRTPERKARKITTKLGQKITRYICKIRLLFGESCEPLFVDSKGSRLSVTDIAKLLKSELRAAGIYKKQVTMLLRHHLGQGLADQGAPAAMIAELLGHNSLVPARAYLAATPNIAKIKEQALGKSPAFQSIMRSLLTGEIINRSDTSSERMVRGIVHTQFIGDIGACALPTHTSCPYNPVYACYTCKKFNPFADGSHVQVETALQQQTQLHIDEAERAGNPVHNRTITQLQTTTLAVRATIERCQKYKEDIADDAV